MANVAFISVHDVRTADTVPGAAGAAVVRFSAVVLTPVGAVVRPGSVPQVFDTANVAFSGTDTAATIQAACLAAVKTAYGDATITGQYL